MQIVGLITEYNPFHNGHLHHLQEALRLTGADAAVCVMSRDFVQRGAPAVMPAAVRTAAALISGAAAVFALPVRYSTASAPLFASAAVRLLDSLGCVDHLCFGAETPDLSLLREAAWLLADEPSEYQDALTENLRRGMSFPAARAKAVYACTGNAQIDQLLTAPNNILAVEYMIALHRLGSRIRPLCIPRIKNSYHDPNLTGRISSATAIRKTLLNDRGADVTTALPFPAEQAQTAAGLTGPCFPISEDDFSAQLHFSLLEKSADELSGFADVTPPLAARIIRLLPAYQSFSSFAMALKTRDMTYTRICRALTHILLGIKDRDPDTPLGYAPLLGIQRERTDVLSHLVGCSHLPILASIRDEAGLSMDERAMRAEDHRAASLYRYAVYQKFGTMLPDEKRQPLMKLPKELLLSER